MHLVTLIILFSILLAGNAYAYLGPGLGLGAIGAFIGMVVAVFLAIVGVIWYPLKRLLRKFKPAKTDSNKNIEDAKSSER